MTTNEPAPSDPPPSSIPLPFTLQDGEDVILVIRRHWIFLWPMMAGQFLAGIVPVVAVGLLLNAVDALDGVPSLVFGVVAAIWLVYWAVRVFLTWYRYRNDIWVITNQRLIDSYRRHPFNLHMSTADLVNVQDMTVLRSGILQTALDFGDINCQTASIDQDFRITGIPNPREVQALVDRERDRERSRPRNV